MLLLKLVTCCLLSAVFAADRIPEDYDPLQKPEGPVTVSLSMHVAHTEWKEEKFIVSLYLRQSWVDKRLISEETSVAKFGPGIEKKLWLPDTFFPSALKVKRFEGEGFVRISPKGEVLWRQRAKVVFPCTTYLKNVWDESANKFNCSLELESYGFAQDDLDYVWKGGVESNQAVTVSSGTGVTIVEKNPFERVQMLSTGNYKRLGVNFLVETQKITDLHACLEQCYKGN
jgi:hypothetical protein